MTNLVAMCVLVCLVLSVASCKDESDKPSPSPIPTPTAAIAAPVPVKSSVQPEYNIEIKTTEAAPSTYVIEWSVVVNTGGWKLTTDTVQVEDEHRELRVAKVYATLEEPKASDPKTQAFATLGDKHDAGAQKVDRAELHIRRAIRGVKSEGAGTYANVRSVGKAR